jgi:prevent-host-death family protein
MRVGLRKANQEFSALIRAVRAGKEVLLTDRERPFARIIPIPGPDSEEALQALEAGGVLRASRRREPMPTCKSFKVRGTAMARTVAEEREE